MFDAERDLLVRGVAAAKAGSKDEARFFLEKLLRLDPPMEMRVDAWQYLAEIADDPAEKRDHIGRAVAADPTNGSIRRALALLDGRLDPADIVNPDRLSPLDSSATTATSGERLSCPQCGSGRLIAASDGQRLVCEHCHYEEAIVFRSADTTGDRDFTATMWTAKGHRTAERTVAFECGSCGASFVLPSGVQSLACSFCGSVHLHSESQSRELLTPDAVLPFGTSASEVRDTLQSELRNEPASDPLPVFLPVWMFTFAGTVRWTGYEPNRDSFASQKEPRSGKYTVIEQVALVCATPRLPQPLQHLVEEFDLSALRAYDPRQLAGYPVATYQITLDAATIAARRKALKALAPVVREEIANLVDLEITFTHVGVDTFRLLLLPFWIAQSGPPDERELTFVNGQNGAIGQNAREPGLLSRIARLAGFSPDSDT